MSKRGKNGEGRAKHKRDTHSVFSEELQQSFHCDARLEANTGATNRGFSQCVTHSRGISVCVTVSLCSINNVSLVTVIQTSPVD